METITNRNARTSVFSWINNNSGKSIKWMSPDVTVYDSISISFPVTLSYSLLQKYHNVIPCFRVDNSFLSVELLVQNRMIDQIEFTVVG